MLTCLDPVLFTFIYTEYTECAKIKKNIIPVPKG